MANELKPAIKSLEGQSLIGVLVATVIAGYAVITGDTESLSPENTQAIIDAGLEQAKSVNEIIQVYKLADSPTDYAKIVEMIAVLIPGTGLLGFFTKKRSDIKVASISTKN